MENWIKYINIHNFKSIRNLKIEDCRRINLFIGYPNVGKSNVLEALGLFSMPYLDFNNHALEESLNKLVRSENFNELFHNASGNSFEIKTNIGKLICSNNYYIHIYFCDIADGVYGFYPDLKTEKVNSGIKNSIVKRYIFQTKNQWKSTGDSQLLPPFGENIIDTLLYNPNVSDAKTWIKQEFQKIGLELVLDKSSNSLKVQKRLGNDEVFILPYSSLADTLQRLIFYKTAIASNQNSVLLFEEPEAHAFPPYIDTMMYDIIKAKTNQFFIVTHSPLVVNAFLENKESREETAIYVFDYQNEQTTAKRLSDEEIELAYEYGDSLFFNLENLLVDEH